MTRYSALGDFTFSGARPEVEEENSQMIGRGARAVRQRAPDAQQKRFLDHVREQMAREAEQTKASGLIRGRMRDVGAGGGPGGAVGLYSGYSRASIGEGESTATAGEGAELRGEGERERRDELRKGALRRMVKERLGDTEVDRERRKALIRERERERIRQRERAQRARALASASKAGFSAKGLGSGDLEQKMRDGQEVNARVGDAAGGNAVRDEDEDTEILRLVRDILKVAGHAESPLTIRETARIQQEALGGFPWGPLSRYDEPPESDDGDSAFGNLRVRVHTCLCVHAWCVVGCV